MTPSRSVDGAEQVADGVWTFAVDDHRCLFVEADDSVVAVNTLGGGDETDQLREAIQSTLPDKPVRHIVYTTDHLDHTGGAARLAPEATVLAHDLCARVVGRRGRGQRTVDRRVGGTGEVVTLDGRRLDLSYPGPTQGTGNLAVTADGSSVLFLVGPRADARYGLFNDVHFRHVARIWRQLATLSFGVVVPGRGPVMQRDQLGKAADYVEALTDAAQHAFADGVPIWVYDAMESYVRERLQGAYGSLDGFDTHVGIGAIRAVHYYLMGGWGLEDTGAPELLGT